MTSYNAETEAPVHLCYNCKVFLVKRSCIKDDSEMYQESIDSKNIQVWNGIRDTAIYNYRKAMILASTISSKVSEVISFGKHMLYESKLDPFDEEVYDFYALNTSDSVLRCNRCFCFYSRVIRCHCFDCLGDDLPSHYVILMHGVLSNPIDMAYIMNVLLDNIPRLFIYLPGCVAGKSLYGINFILKTLSQELRTLFSKLPKCVRMSLIGHSFGGILLRYWHLFYTKGSLGFFDSVSPANDDTSEGVDGNNGNAGQFQEFYDAKENLGMLNIEWMNLITLATPHAGIYENALGFRKIVSLIGSDTINELDNDTIDLLYLISDDGLESLKKFKNVLFYGNISGDHMVAPRTSIILPYSLVTKKLLNEFTKITKQHPGVPHDVSYMIRKLEKSSKWKDLNNSDGSSTYTSIETRSLDSSRESSSLKPSFDFSSLDSSGDCSSREVKSQGSTHIAKEVNIAEVGGRYDVSLLEGPSSLDSSGGCLGVESKDVYADVVSGNFDDSNGSDDTTPTFDTLGNNIFSTVSRFPYLFFPDPSPMFKYGTREDCINYFTKKFQRYLSERIKKTTHINCLYRSAAVADSDGLDDPTLRECLKVFTRNDLESFNSIITIIIMNASDELLKNMDANNKLLLTEVQLLALYSLGVSRYAVCIPMLHVPHRSIVMNIDGPLHNYTLKILTHLCNQFKL